MSDFFSLKKSSTEVSGMKCPVHQEIDLIEVDHITVWCPKCRLKRVREDIVL